MPNLHPARQVRNISGNAVHLMVNLKHEKVNLGAFENFVQLWVGICELHLTDPNDFFIDLSMIRSSPSISGLTILLPWNTYA